MNRSKKVIFSLLVPAVLLGGSEVFFRVFPVSGTARTGEGWVEVSTVPGWDLEAEGNVALNLPASEVDRYLMRSPGYSEPKDEAVRIVAAGDSCSFGFGLQWRDTVIARLARLREARFPDREYQPAACAVPGHTSLQTLAKLEAGCLDFEPDVVIIGNQFNDASLTDMSDEERFDRGTLHRLRRAARASAVVETLADLLLPPPPVAEKKASGGCHTGWLAPGADLCPATAKTAHRVALPLYVENLHRMIDLVRERGGAPVLLAFPHRSDSTATEHYDFHDYRAAMKEVADAEGVTFVDGTAAFAKAGKSPTDLFTDMVHPSAEGARVLALAIDRTLGSEAP